jgi:hypothetical protein
VHPNASDESVTSAIAVHPSSLNSELVYATATATAEPSPPCAHLGTRSLQPSAAGYRRAETLPIDDRFIMQH